MNTPPRFCAACRTNRVAWTAPRVDYCYACLPGGPFTPPLCQACGSEDYFCQGLCGVCHPSAPDHPGACKDCLAWGVLRKHNWRCWSCRGWRYRHPVDNCPYCGESRPLAAHGACRLCWHQALTARQPDEPIELAEANRFGQQLFLANMHYQPRGPRRGSRQPRRFRASAPSRGQAEQTDFAVVDSEQLALFWSRPDLRRAQSLPAAPDSIMSRYCDTVLHEHAARNGWSKRLINVVSRSLDMVQAQQPTPGAKIKASEARSLLTQDGLTADSTLEVLAAAGLLIDDRVPAIRTYFLAQTAALPDAIRAQLEIWYTIMAEGTAVPPRRKPRHPQTIRIQLQAMVPRLQAWADDGHESLAEITPDDIHAALTGTAAQRKLVGQALRSLFRILKSRKEIFTNPTASISTERPAASTPMPIDTTTIQDALNAPHPARALAVALVAFHGLTAGQITKILITDVRDSRLTLDGRTIPLAGPVRTRLRAYLDYRNQRWPNTANPHLLVNRKSAPHVTPVAARYPWHRYPLAPRPLREDRILHEVHATGGDVRRICDLFGLSIKGAMRYQAVLEHPDLTE